MRKAWRVRNDGVGNERPDLHSTRILRLAIVLLDLACIGAGSPTALQDLSHPLSPLTHVPGFQGLHAWNESWVLNHKCHQLSRIAADFKEFQVVLLDKLLEGPMSG